MAESPLQVNLLVGDHSIIYRRLTTYPSTIITMKKVAKHVRTLTRNNCWIYNVLFVGRSCISDQTDSGIGSNPLKNSMAMKGPSAKELQVSRPTSAAEGVNVHTSYHAGC